MLKRIIGIFSVALLSAVSAFPGEARFGPRERAELVNSLAAREAMLTALIQ